jgi:hypothetical protein
MLRKPSVFRTASELLIIGLLIAVVLNYQFFLDRYALITFRPSVAVGTIEPRLSLTEAGRAMFYRATPEVDDKVSFNRNCQTNRGELELGCYYRGRIYILQIANASLKPEMDVVAAHELLHAAWMRLSSRERADLTRQLQQVYASLGDADLRTRMADYAKSEPGQEANELHSILATEQVKLPADLERYYRRYFVDRARIVVAHAAYEGVFTTRRAELEHELATIRSLKGQLAVVNRQLESYRAVGQIDQYNALVPRQNHLVDDINTRINRYQIGADEYNALSRSLDSQQITDTETTVE